MDGIAAHRCRSTNQSSADGNPAPSALRPRNIVIRPRFDSHRGHRYRLAAMPRALSEHTSRYRKVGDLCMIIRAPALLVMALAGAGCASGPNLSTDYAQTAIENYELAEAEFIDRDWEQATSFADFVRIRFPFSRYSVEAELLAARAQYELGNYLRARDAFRQFAKLHPTHEHVVNGWADYMVAVCAYMSVPESNWPLPAHYELDQASLQSSLEELDYFFDRHAQKAMAEHAGELRARIHRKLLEHELYVAKFYLERERPEAAIGRLEAAHGKFPGIGMDAELLFVLGRTYLDMGEIELARGTFYELNSEHEDHHKGKQAGVYLAYIHKTHGPADASRQRPDRSRPTPKRPPRLKKGVFGRDDSEAEAVKGRTKSAPKSEPAAEKSKAEHERATPAAASGAEGEQSKPEDSASGAASSQAAPTSETTPETSEKPQARNG